MVQCATEITLDADGFPLPPDVVTPPRNRQPVCCLALCGIHLGPLVYLSTSSVVQPHIQYFENTAARELFEFQVSLCDMICWMDYVRCLYCGFRILRMRSASSMWLRWKTSLIMVLVQSYDESYQVVYLISPRLSSYTSSCKMTKLSLLVRSHPNSAFFFDVSTDTFRSIHFNQSPSYTPCLVYQWRCIQVLSLEPSCLSSQTGH